MNSKDMNMEMTPVTGSPDDDLFKQAAAQVDAEYANRPAEDGVEAQPPKTILGRGVDLWKSAGAGIAKAGFETKDFLMGEIDEADKSDLRRGIEQRGRELDAASPLNAITSDITQFATGLIGAGKLMAPFKAAQKLQAAGKAGRAAFEIGKGAAAGAIVIDPHEERLSNLIESYPALQNPVTEYLAADPLNSAAEGRFKNAMEGIGLDLAIVGVLGASVRAIRYLREGEEAKAAKELTKLEKAQPATETHTAPSTPAESSLPAKEQTPLSESPSGEQARLDFEERAAILEYEGGLPRAEAERQAAIETGYKSEDTGNAITPSRPDTVEVSETNLAEILRATDQDLQALSKFGTREAAIEAGQILSRGSRLPWQKLRATDEVKAFVDNAATVLKDQMDARKGGDILSDSKVTSMVQARAALFGEDPSMMMGQLAEAGDAASTMAANMEAAYLISNRMFQETYDAAFKVRNGMLDEWGGDAAKAGEELKARLMASADLLASAKSMSSNSGRALRRMRGQFQIKPEDLEQVKGLDGAALADLIYSTKGDPNPLQSNISKFKALLEAASTC